MSILLYWYEERFAQSEIMHLKNNRHSFGWLTMLLHWSMALVIISLLFLGWYITTIDYYHTYYHTLFHYHRSLGVVGFSLAFINAFWYMINTKPDYPPSVKKHEVFLAKCLHVILILLTLAVPISGFMISSAAGKNIEVFNWSSLPNIFPHGHAYLQQSGILHAWLGYGMACLIGLHAIAALKHEFYDKNGILRRMLGFKI